MTTFLLVPGAALGRWALDDVVRDLRARGYDASAISLTGLADRADEATPDTNLQTHVDDVVSAVRALETNDVVLVGHSYAGAVVAEAAPAVADHLQRLVLLAGMVLPAGMSMMEMLPPGAEEPFLAAVVDGPHGELQPPMTREQLDLYWGDHGLAGAAGQAWDDRATPHPVGTYRSPARVGPDGLGDLPRTSISCAGDPGPATSPGPDWDQRELATGHWPMLTDPTLLVDLLVDIASADDDLPSD